jgi:Family of unknown function (DUF6082)
MNLATLSAIAQIVGSAAILITLAYLAIQTRQNTIAIRGSTRHAVLGEEMDLLNKLIENPFLTHVFSGDITDLTEDQKVQVGAYLRMIVRTREIHWFQYENGVIDEATWKSYRQPIKHMFSAEVTRAWWRSAKAMAVWDRKFVEHVDAYLDTLPVRSMTPGQWSGFQ